jgi:hypothetical protein
MGSAKTDKGRAIRRPKVPPRQCITTGSDELDRLLGGGLTKGSTVLLRGAPGAGRLTAAAAIAAGVAAAGQRVRVCSEDVAGASRAMRKAAEASAIASIVPVARDWAALPGALRSDPPCLLVLDLLACDGYSHAAIFGARGLRDLCKEVGIVLIVLLPAGKWEHVLHEADVALVSAGAKGGVTVTSSKNRYAKLGSALLARPTAAAPSP